MSSPVRSGQSRQSQSGLEPRPGRWPRVRIDRLLGQDDAVLVQEGRQSVDRTARRVEGEASALGLTVDRHCLAASGPRSVLASRRSCLGKVADERVGEGVGIEPTQESLESRLVGGDADREAQALRNSWHWSAPHSAMASTER